ncbi:MAG: DUF2723 domain-containing protein [Chloroflexi bacterium]|nr:MAG: DUF2723 domain-containing protein [Chloroflexota bacterium]
MERHQYAAGRHRNLSRWVGAALALAAFALYVRTLAPGVLPADAGEFQFVPWLPGIAHPTGYPLYILLGWLWTHLLPLGSVAYRMNLLSAVAAALAVAAVYGLARRMLAQSLPDTPPPAQIGAAAVAAATFAVTPTFWSQAVIAEVYALHALIVALILGQALRFGAQKNRRNSLLLALLFGLGLTHHSTTVLLLPALLLYLWLADRWGGPQTSPAEKARWLAVHALVAAAPLLLYLYLPLAAPGTPYATLQLSEHQTLTLYQNSAAGWLRHVTATVFTGQVQPEAVGPERFGLSGRLLLQQVGWVGILLAALGVAALTRRRCFAVLALTGAGALAIAAFNLIYFIGDVFVLFIPVWLIICLWLGAGVLEISHRIATRFVRSRLKSTREYTVGQIKERLQTNMTRLVAAGLTLFFFAIPVAQVVTYFSAVDQSANRAAALRWQQILSEPIPESAILLSNDRNEIMPMWYKQYVDRQRPDLTGLFPLIVPEPAFANVGRVLDEALESGRPVYLIKPMDGLSLKAELTPNGSLYRAAAYTAPPAHLLDIPLPPATINNHPQSVTLTGFDVMPNPAAPGSSVAVTLHWQAAQPLSANFTSYVHLLAPDGRRVAQSDHQPGGNYYPTSLWQPGEPLRDRHTIVLPADVAPGRYTLRAGMYVQPEPGVLIGMGDGVDIGEVGVE